MLKPVIMIGCGGAGQKTVRYVRDGVMRHLKRQGWAGEFPQAWQFLGIDAPTVQEDLSIPLLPNADYLSITTGGSTWRGFNQAVDAKFGLDVNPKAFQQLQGWRPNPSQLEIPLPSAYPGVRAVGRLTGLLALQSQVAKRLSYAFTQCVAGGPDLSEVSRHLGVNVPPGTAVPDPITIVVGSMAGATGSAIMLDVVDLVRRTDIKGAFPVLVAFTPDIFGSIQTDAMTANSAAFMAEMLSAYWDNENTDSSLIPATVSVNTRGPHSAYLIGRTNNDGLDLLDSKNVYRAVGETLAAVTTSPIVQSLFSDFILVDWVPKSRMNSGGYGFHDTSFPGFASSFGSATISIGRDRFRDYLGKLLHRSIVEHLVEGFEAAAASEFGDTAKTMAGPEKIFELVQRRRTEFAIACGLHEPADGSKLVSDRFVSREILRVRLGEVSNKIRAPFAGAAQQGASAWQQTLTAQAAQVKAAELVAMESELKSSLRKWGTEILEKVLRATTEFSGTQSLPVTLELLRSLRAQVLQTSGQMLDDAEKARHSAKEAARRAQAHFGGNQRGVLTMDHLSVYEFIQDLATEIVLAWSAQVREKLAQALESVAANMLSNLEGSVNQALTRIHSLTNPRDGRPAEVALWPKNDDVVPTSFAPSPTEFLLEDHSTWPDTAKTLLSKSLGDSVGSPIDPIEAARQLIIRGDFGGDADEPAVAPFVWASSASGPLVWEPGQDIQTVICDGVDALAARIDAWLTRPHTAVCRFVTEGLASYLLPVDFKTGASIPDHQQRLVTFRQSLIMALMQSRPLMEIDNVRNATVHPQALSYSLCIQGFPFGQGHPAREETEQVIQGFLNDARDVSWAFTGDDAESVSITNFLKFPVHPSVVTSFTQPLHGALSHFSPALLKSSFWRWRRARLLENFIPLPDDLRVAAIRGFAVARILGTMTALPAGNNQISTKSGVLNFPPNLLTETDRNNVLPALLESMILAFADVPTRGKAAFEAYGALIDYGLGGRTTTDFQIEGVAAQILSTGDYGNVRVVDEARANALKNDPNGRIAHAIAYLDAIINHYDLLDSKPLSPKSWKNEVGSVDPADTLTMELLGDLRKSYIQVREAMERFEESVRNPSAIF